MEISDIGFNRSVFNPDDALTNKVSNKCLDIPIRPSKRDNPVEQWFIRNRQPSDTINQSSSDPIPEREKCNDKIRANVDDSDPSDSIDDDKLRCSEEDAIFAEAYEEDNHHGCYD